MIVYVPVLASHDANVPLIHTVTSPATLASQLELEVSVLYLASRRSAAERSSAAVTAVTVEVGTTDEGVIATAVPDIVGTGSDEVTRANWAEEAAEEPAVTIEGSVIAAPPMRLSVVVGRTK